MTFPRSRNSPTVFAASLALGISDFRILFIIFCVVFVSDFVAYNIDNNANGYKRNDSFNFHGLMHKGFSRKVKTNFQKFSIYL